MFTKEQAQYLLSLVLKQPLNMTIGQAVKGDKLNNDIVIIINTLGEIINPKPKETNEKAKQTRKGKEAIKS